MKILFVCLGNICRSPMAEFLLKDKLTDIGLAKKIQVTSKGTGGYHNGAFMHKETSKILQRLNISHDDFISSQVHKQDIKNYDLIFGMDDNNISDLIQIFEKKDNKITKITDIADIKETHIPDPWYTGDFELTYNLLNKCCDDLVSFIQKKLAD